MVPPDEFIPIAEESGFIVRLGEWVLQAACTQNKAWQHSGLSPLRISVNLSARQLKQPDFLATVKRILELSKLSPEHLEVELTESILMGDMEGSKAVLSELKRLGIYVSIDDFGTGYSSLSYLKHLPIDALKIDRSFIQGIVDDADNQAITDAIIAMAQRLRLHVVAEGIETQAQLDYLSARGCDEAQGYFIGRPAPALAQHSIWRRTASRSSLSPEP